MIQLKLHRKRYSDKQVIGTMDVYHYNDFLFSLATLEQDWNNNEISKSCVPPGFYQVSHWDSNRFGDSFILLNTSPRSHILIHSGNYHTSTEGCILVGLTHDDINGDGYIDVSSSRDAMDKLREVCDGENVITITIE